MKTQTIAGPFKSRKDAESTMRALGFKNHSVFSTCENKIDSDGNTYTDFDDETFFVERLLDVASDTIFGYGVNEFMAKQYKATQ